MNNRNDQIWIAGYNTDLELYEPQRQFRMMTPRDKCHEDRGECQDECDRKNSPANDRGQNIVLTSEKPKPDAII